jgi:hypothetical protein
MTNESIEAIMAGMNPQSGDVILTVASSAELPLAFVEYASLVVAVDLSKESLAWTHKGLRYVRESKFPNFRDMRMYWGNKAYFSQPGRLARIQSRMHRLQIEEDDVFRVAQEVPGFNKIYLSNCLTHAKGEGTGGSTAVLERLAKSLPNKTSVYVSDGHQIYHDSGGWMGWPKGIDLDKESTERAKRLERGIWIPQVFNTTIPTTSPSQLSQK